MATIPPQSYNNGIKKVGSETLLEENKILQGPIHVKVTPHAKDFHWGPPLGEARSQECETGSGPGSTPWGLHSLWPAGILESALDEMKSYTFISILNGAFNRPCCLKHVRFGIGCCAFIVPSVTAIKMVFREIVAKSRKEGC
ncbi:hypothetical protein CEXT_218551 [Caerostris extrusa]|uniref:Uncharacterized protein n=1 Tax=Caerostris extrusa TaxID=172846 RepID=A0AAV4TET5_CAEEX|nr:hypothetical protein CEXT_218551 [Caerostris extrusa]